MARPKGSLNTKSIALKTMILGALDKMGGMDYLVQQAQLNPTAFLTLIGKLIPIDVDITKTQINVHVGLYPDEQNERHTIDASQEAVTGIH